MSINPESGAFRHSELLRFRWPLLLGLVALAVSPQDEALVLFLNPDQPHALDGIALWMDAWSTRSLILLLFSALVAAYWSLRFVAWRLPTTAFAIAFIGVEVVVGSLKRVAGRPRPIHPDGLGSALRGLYDRADTKSFPSGHAAAAFCCALVLALWIRRPIWRGLILAFAASVAISRCYVGAHYPSDILAGAAIGWAITALAWKLAVLWRAQLGIVTAPARMRGLTALAALIVFSWLVKASPPEPIDLATGESLESYRIAEPRLKTVFEPVLGPSLAVSSLPDLKDWRNAAAGWLIVASIIMIWWKRRRGIAAVGCLLVLGALVGVIGLSGEALQGGLISTPDESSKSQAPLAFDLQSHIGDPTDGAMELEDGLDRYAALGYDLVLPTHHNRWSRARLRKSDGDWEEVDLWGMEWSSGSHLDSPFHVLIYNRRPEPANLAGVNDWREMVQSARTAGALVVPAHFWRGDAARLPKLADLVVAGVDGFEIAGRSQEYRAEPIERQLAIKRVVEESGLLALANGDFHGKRAANYQWNLLERNLGAAGEARSRVDELWSALKGESHRILCVGLERTRPSSGFIGWLGPPHTAVSYFRELSLRGRVAWLGWIGIAVLVVEGRRRRGRAGSKDQ